MNKNKPDNTGINQWLQIKDAPTSIEPWLELLGSYLKNNLNFPAIYVANKIFQLRPDLKAEIDQSGLVNWQVENLDAIIFGQIENGQAQILHAKILDWLQENPDDWICWIYSVGLCELGDIHSASLAHAFERACSLEYIEGESHHLLGLWRLKAGRNSMAIDAFSQLLDIYPVRHGSMMYLGLALLKTGNIPAAEKAFARASLSNNPAFLSLLAGKVYANNYWQEAIEVLKKACTLDTRNIAFWLQLAQIQSEVYLLADCKESLNQALTLEPNSERIKLLEAGLAGKVGDAALHLKQLELSYANEAEPSTSRIISSIAMTSLYQDEMSAQEIAHKHRSLCAKIEESVETLDQFSNILDKSRPLRVGYVTGDLHRQHPVCIFMLPLLMEQSKSNLEIFIYHTGLMHDQYTQRAKECVDKWVEAAEYDDGALRRAIMRDEIDVLIDLAGHTSTHRLGVFAMRAAPVQITFLGYPHSTGLSRMDHLIGDLVVSPENHQSLFSERLLNLPSTVFCWSPVDDYPLPVARAKSLPPVFGSFNNVMKLTPKTIALWSRILLAVPESALLLKAPSLADRAVCQRLVSLFADHGVHQERIEFRGPSELSAMMQEYGDVDIALDPPIYNGGTTSLQALWMGVPIITLEGQNFASRMGASFLTALGRPEWLAKDDDQYVSIATNLVSNLQNIRDGRSKLRGQMTKSPLCNIKKYAKNYEDLLHKAWAEYVDARTIK